MTRSLSMRWFAVQPGAAVRFSTSASDPCWTSLGTTTSWRRRDSASWSTGRRTERSAHFAYLELEGSWQVVTLQQGLETPASICG